MPFNPEIHNRKSIRLPGYDYSREGLYFITICTKNKEHLFGHIANGNMFLNDIGQIAHQCWAAIPDHFPNAALHAFVIMPNHLHGIIELKNGGGNLTIGGVSAVGVENFQPLPPPPPTPEPLTLTPQRHAFQQMIPRSIAAIVKGFKIGVTNWCREHTDIETVWQRNYYEHIVRDDASYDRISKYIICNPEKWGMDKFNR